MKCAHTAKNCSLATAFMLVQGQGNDVVKREKFTEGERLSKFLEGGGIR
jgi:hypothetical protein